MTLKNTAERAVILFAPVVVAVVLLFPAVAGRSIPLDVTAVLATPPWEEARPAGFVPTNDPNAIQEALEYYPNYAFLSASTGGSGGPSWNPMNACGQPFLAIWRTRCLSPFSVPFYVLPLSLALTVSVLLKFIVAGWSAYFAGRRFNLPPPLALAGAMAFELSVPFVLWQSAPLTDALPWMPLLIVASEKLGVGFTRGWPQCALLVALMALGGGPQITIAAVVFVAIYIALRMLMARQPGPAITALVAMGMSAVVGVALASIQVVPYAEYLRQAAGTQDSSPVIFRFPDLAATFFLSFWNMGSSEDTARNPNVLRLLYIGLVQVWFIALWLSVHKFSPAIQRRRMDSLLLASVTLSVLAFCGHYVPGLRLLRPEIWLAFNALTAGLVSGVAAAEWLALNVQECKYVIKRLVIYLSVVGLIAVLTVAFQWSLVNSHPWLFVFRLCLSVVLFACAAGLLVATLLRPSIPIMGYGLAALTILAFAASDLQVRFTPKELAFPPTGLIEVLQQANARISGSSKLAQWPLEGNAVPQVYSTDRNLLARQETFFEKSRQDPLWLLRAGTPMLLLTGEDIRGAFAPLRASISIRHVFTSGAILFECLDSKPRAWLAYQTRSIDELTPEVLDPKLPPAIEYKLLPTRGPGPEGRATVAESSNTFVAVEVDTDRPAVLVLTDTWYPGWTAMVDSQNAAVFPVDGLFRGVEVPEGKHRIVFQYSPLSLRLGFYITLAAAFVVIAGFWKTAMEWIFMHRGE